MDAGFKIAIYCIVFLYGIVIGSFLNVCIYRIPLGQSLSKQRSHCMTCGYQLRWFDLIPLFSWLFLRGKCRKCGAKISAQYPIVEAANGLLYVLVFVVHGFGTVTSLVESILYCLMASALLALSVIDFRTFIIPFGFNVFIFCLGAVNLGYRIFFTERPDIMLYIIGIFATSVIAGILYFCKAMGGGDVKLLAATGFLLGWKLSLLSFFVGCIIGAIIHPIRMKVSKQGRTLAMGPYLSAGIMFAALWGNKFLDWYLKFTGLNKLFNS
ncbi:MAG: prepilin peptidase [Lachnospiraceae bacterium]|nr:prepilin peptidase [Lachnospiraceae bacterium]